MANSCINIKSKEFRDLVLISGLPDIVVEAYCYKYMNRYGRFPYLDELLNSNSEPFLRQSIGLNKNNFTSLKKLLDYTGLGDLLSAIISINNLHRDLQITPLRLDDDNILLDILHSPKLYSETYQPLELVNNVNAGIIIDTFCDKLASLYGVNIVPITISEINENQELRNIPNVSISRAFIYNNTIYINVDNASIDSKVHELLHLLFASMRDINPELYFNFIQKAQSFLEFDNIAKRYPNRTMGDLLEEVFVTELSKYLVGLDSSISNLSESEYKEIHYQITRMLDLLFEGEISSRCIPENQLYNLGFGEIGKRVNSPITGYKFMGSLDNTKIHRMLANTKSKLIKEKRLKEVCE